MGSRSEAVAAPDLAVLDAHPIRLDGFTLHAQGAAVTGRPTFDQWAAAFTFACAVEQASPFWIGDLLAYGEHRHGERATQVLEASGYALQTCANAAYVAKAVPPDRRRPDVSYSHHAEVAPLPAAEQTRLLAEAAAGEWTVRELRTRVRRTTVRPEAAVWVAVRCASMADAERLVARLEAEGRVCRVDVKGAA